MDIFDVDASNYYSQPAAASGPKEFPVGLVHIMNTGNGVSGSGPALRPDDLANELNEIVGITGGGGGGDALTGSITYNRSNQASVGPMTQVARVSAPTASAPGPVAGQGGSSMASSLYTNLGNLFGGVAEDAYSNPSAAEWQAAPPLYTSPGTNTSPSTNTYSANTTNSYHSAPSAPPSSFQNAPPPNRSQGYASRTEDGASRSQDRLDRKNRRILLKKIRRLCAANPDVFHMTTSEASTLDELEDEHEMFNDENKQTVGVDIIKFAFKGLCSTIEWANEAWNPIGFKLQGLGQTAAEKMEELEPHFIELQESYKDIEIPTEAMIVVKTAFMIGALNYANNYMANAVRDDPSMSKIRNDPNVQRAVHTAAAQAYSPIIPPMETNNRPRPKNPNPLPGKPADYNPQAAPSASTRPAVGPNFTSRPDLAYASNNASARDRSVTDTYVPPQRTDPGVSLSAPAPYSSQADMVGPAHDVDLFLSGLKACVPTGAAPVGAEDAESIGSFEETTASGVKRRKPKNQRSTIALDI